MAPLYTLPEGALYPEKCAECGHAFGPISPGYLLQCQRSQCRVFVHASRLLRCCPVCCQGEAMLVIRMAAAKLEPPSDLAEVRRKAALAKRKGGFASDGSLIQRLPDSLEERKVAALERIAAALEKKPRKPKEGKDD